MSEFIQYSMSNIQIKFIHNHERCQLLTNCITQFQNMTSIMRPACLCLQMLGVCWGAFHLYLLTCRQKKASKYSDSENIFHVFVHLYLYKFSLAFISSWESKNVTLFIFWHCIMKMGFKKKQNNTWHLTKTKAMGTSWNR